MTTLLLTGTALTVLLLDIAARRAAARTLPATADGTYFHKLDWLADHAPHRPATPARTSSGWTELVLTDWGEAEDVLDDLEALGVDELEVRAVNDSTVTLRWR